MYIKNFKKIKLLSSIILPCQFASSIGRDASPRCVLSTVYKQSIHIMTIKYPFNRILIITPL